jgi:hypothetical protein
MDVSAHPAHQDVRHLHGPLQTYSGKVSITGLSEGHHVTQKS